MKALLVITLLLSSMIATAAPIKLMEFNHSRDVDLFRTMFRVNKELKRAWVEVTISDYSFGESHYSDTRVKVPGLAYDPEINGVIYQDASGEQIICGTFYNARWVLDRGMSFKETGRCQFRTNRYVKEIDDGFTIRKQDMTEVILDIY